ncbi:MAG: ATP-grasp fold amidoligase family protein [Leucobacter sp.]
MKSKIFHVLNLKKRLRHWDDERYLKLMYLLRFGKRLHLDEPTTFNEKLQWLKLNYQDPAKATLVDKFEVKAWVAEQIGVEHVIPTLGVYETVEAIDFDALPSAFVLKATHDSGGVVLVRDKSQLDVSAAREKLQRSLNRSYFEAGREPEYKLVKPRIIAEPFIVDDEIGQLRDYKFFCFDGEVKAMFVASDRAEGQLKFDYFDADYNPLDLRQPYPTSTVKPPKPARYDEMLELSRKLSQGQPHVRVDLYEANGRLYFGEMTFFHFGGMQPFIPAKWDKIWGDWLTLPEPIRP